MASLALRPYFSSSFSSLRTGRQLHLAVTISRQLWGRNVPDTLDVEERVLQCKKFEVSLGHCECECALRMLLCWAGSSQRGAAGHETRRGTSTYRRPALGHRGAAKCRPDTADSTCCITHMSASAVGKSRVTCVATSWLTRSWLCRGNVASLLIT